MSWQDEVEKLYTELTDDQARRLREIERAISDSSYDNGWGDGYNEGYHVGYHDGLEEAS